MAFTAMPGSGARIGTAKTTTPNRPQTIQPAQLPAISMCSVAAPGAAGRSAPVPPSAPVACRAAGSATALVSGLPGLSSNRHRRFFDVYASPWRRPIPHRQRAAPDPRTPATSATAYRQVRRSRRPRPKVTAARSLQTWVPRRSVLRRLAPPLVQLTKTRGSFRCQ
jgi:hypothetical protein